MDLAFILQSPSKRQRLDGDFRAQGSDKTDASFDTGFANTGSDDSQHLIDIAMTYEEPIVCFGSVTGIRGRCTRRGACPESFPATIESAERFLAESFDIRGVILPEFGHMVHGLVEEPTLQLYACCTLGLDPSNRRSATLNTQVFCTLDVTVYGPVDLFDTIGNWFQDYDVYLQDPRASHLDVWLPSTTITQTQRPRPPTNVRYCNPHKLSADDLQSCPLLSEVILQSTGLAYLQDVVHRPDVLDVLSHQANLEETPQPHYVISTLHKHQRQALTFMLGREKGWNFDRNTSDIWESSESTQGQWFINNISDTNQSEAPPPFSGGVIADPMGLGKTLTMIALAATDLDNVGPTAHGYEELNESKPAVQTTLIVVPQPLLDTWEEQLGEHVQKGSIRSCRHHGKSRISQVHDLNSMNVVLTTYHTLAADWKAWKAGKDSVMFSVCWRRVILDEAHIIRNLKSRMSRSVCEIDAQSRWAVTGTPVQNHLSDLAALLKFVRVSPYDDPRRFETDISRLWKSGEDELAVKRLKYLSRCLVLRRAKSTIDLPARHDKNCPVDFSPAERVLYEGIRQQTITKLDDVLHGETEAPTSATYVNFLQQIESMRLVCNLGLYYHKRHDGLVAQWASEWADAAQEAFNVHHEMNNLNCSQCSTALDLTDVAFDDNLHLEPPQFSRCLKYACPDCTYRLRENGLKMVCGHTPRCPVASISLIDSAFSDSVFGSVSNAVPQQTQLLPSGLPSKIEVLIADINALPTDTKCIVFSTWRLTLDLVESGLNQANIRSVRFDGKVPQAQRQSVLTQFKTDPTIRIMLLTLSCGAVGLTLTEASRAYLMEPHWNPTIEEQALARIHRIGQLKEVTTIRFYIRDSFEETVMEVQEKKRNLAGVLLSGHDGGQADDSLGALQRLRSLL